MARYRWDTVKQRLVPVSTEWVPTARQVARADVSYMDGVSTTEGVDISSKRKRREYMKAHNLADHDDFKGQWAKQEQERIAGTPQERRERRNDVAEAMHKLNTR